MAPHTTDKLKSKNLIIFDLPAVINYNHLPLRACLRNAVYKVLPTEIELAEIDWANNCSGVVMDIFMKVNGQFPTNIQYDQIKQNFMKGLKDYFIDNEETFDVWPGIQNILSSLDKKPNWEYVIISDYWLENTRFILDSCGIFSRGLNLYTAENGLSSKDIVKQLTQNNENTELCTTYLLANDIKFEKKLKEATRWSYIEPPRKTKTGVLKYPQFSKLFTKVAG